MLQQMLRCADFRLAAEAFSENLQEAFHTATTRTSFSAGAAAAQSSKANPVASEYCLDRVASEYCLDRVASEYCLDRVASEYWLDRVALDHVGWRQRHRR
jgi:hypothetical protein